MNGGCKIDQSRRWAIRRAESSYFVLDHPLRTIHKTRRFSMLELQKNTPQYRPSPLPACANWTIIGEREGQLENEQFLTARFPRVFGPKPKSGVRIQLGSDSRQIRKGEPHDESKATRQNGGGNGLKAGCICTSSLVEHFTDRASAGQWKQRRGAACPDRLCDISCPTQSRRERPRATPLGGARQLHCQCSG